ncbi:MAG: hypothetical protein ACI9BW_002273 [Gammaproteobacteria bacterium]|jgi:uncharacterized protein
MNLIYRQSLLFILLLLCCSLTTYVHGATFPDKPQKSDFFVDSAALLNAEARKAINDASSALLKQEQIALFVVTIPSLSSYEATGLGIEKYASELFNEWGIGSQERNYGMMLLVSAGDRKARIELGAGFEHNYDNQSRDVMRSLIIPAFKRGDYSTGIADGVRGMDAMARGLQLPKPTTPWWFFPAIIGVAIFLGFVIYNLFKSGRSGWAWALIAFIAVVLFFLMRNSGRSGGGFGGGSSGGGGATGSW